MDPPSRSLRRDGTPVDAYDHWLEGRGGRFDQHLLAVARDRVLRHEDFRQAFVDRNGEEREFAAPLVSQPIGCGEPFAGEIDSTSLTPAANA